MNDVQLISVNDIKELTSISKNIQPELLEPYILIAEESYSYNILGDALVSELKDQITGNSLSALNNQLLKIYIRPVVAWSAWHEYVPFGAIKSVQKGEVLQSSDNSTNASLEELAFKRQALKDKITFFQDRLQEYLEKNKASYPLYRSSCTTNNNNYSNGIYLGRY